MKRNLGAMFDLRRDQDTPAAIDDAIRGGVRAVGTNLWVLIFAILIASVGLNTNSTAVIIGAMLISPLMGPIVGIGYGAGIKDFTLIKLAGRTLLIFTLFSLLTSTLYFVLSPLDTPRSEILARTTPTIWDVLIAFFGGAAGIVAISRKEVSNVVPGVAIATALMPPLCTAGFGLAHQNWTLFGGAFYLYAINSVFIALATLLFVKILKLPMHKKADEEKVTRTRWFIGIIVAGMIIPSAYLGYRLVQGEMFHAAANHAIARVSHNTAFSVLNSRIDPEHKKIQLFIVGQVNLTDVEKQIAQEMKSRGIADSSILVRRADGEQIDMGSLRRELREELYTNSLKQIETLSAANQALVQENDAMKRLPQDTSNLAKEIRAQYPEISAVSITAGFESANGQAAPLALTVVSLQSRKRLSNTTQRKIRAWLAARFAPQKTRVFFQTG